MRISDWSSDVCSSDLENLHWGMRHDDRRTRSTRSGRGRAQTSACEDPLSLGAWAVRFAFPFQRAAAEMSSSHILRLSARCYCREVQGWPARCKRAQAPSPPSCRLTCHQRYARFLVGLQQGPAACICEATMRSEERRVGKESVSTCKYR